MKPYILLFAILVFLIIASIVTLSGAYIIMNLTETPAPMTSTTVSTTITSTVEETTTLSDLTTISTLPSTTTILSQTSSKFSLNVTPVSFNPDDPETLRLHKADMAVVTVSDDGGNPVSGASVYLGDDSAGVTDSGGTLRIGPLKDGDLTVRVEKIGFNPARLDVNVWESSYGLSTHVRRRLASSVRDDYISRGFVNFRFYDLPSCAICRVMRPKVSDIVSPNRDCIVYEIISLWKYNKELAGKFGLMQTPVIEIEGSNGMFQTSGYVSPAKLEDLIEKASPSCDVS